MATDIQNNAVRKARQLDQNPRAGKVNPAIANTPQKLSSSSMPTNGMVRLTKGAENTGTIWLGGSTLGYTTEPVNAYPFTVDELLLFVNDLENLYFLGSITTDTVYWSLF